MPRRLVIILTILLLIPILCFAGPRVCVEKSTGKILSFGYENLSRFTDGPDKNKYEVHTVAIDKLPDDIGFCEWYEEKDVEGNVISSGVRINQTYKNQTIKAKEKEAKITSRIREKVDTKYRQEATDELIAEGEIEP